MQYNNAFTVTVRALGFAPEADAEGWYYRRNSPIDRFDDHFLAIRYRPEGRKVRMRLVPDRSVTNMNGVIHGGFLMAFVDYALFLIPIAQGVDRVLGGATIDASTQFYAPARADAPVDMVGEVMRETGRMVFTRGIFEQNGEAIGGFSGTVRRRNAADAAERLAEFVRMRN